MSRRLICLLLLSLGLSALPSAFAGVAPGAPTYTHPRLYFNAEELEKLRALRDKGAHALIWHNIAESADWCLNRTQQAKRIGPIVPDPNNENLYDRFYALMGDLAITEHLSFAYALGDKEEYGIAARTWLLALVREWYHEGEGTPDSGNAYSVTRLLKAIAVGYDLAYDRLSPQERVEIRHVVEGIGHAYFIGYFQTEAVSGPDFHAHQAVVEWGSFGVVALTFLGEIPEAREWLMATITKFENDLLPNGLEPDGAAFEGPGFWAAAMQYRIFFMAALRHVTDIDLFTKYAKYMNSDYALAAIACEQNSVYSQNSASVVLQPSYAQLGYHSPVLLFLAHQYRHPIYQYLALWDHTLGQLQKTRYITANRYQLLFDFGGYAYIWCDSSVRPKISGAKLSYRFSSVDEGYLRASWEPGDIVAGVRKGELAVNAGGQAVLVEPSLSLTDFHVQKMEDDGLAAKLICGNETNHLKLELNRAERTLRISRETDKPWVWSCQGKAMRNKNEIWWDQRTQLRVVEGEITAYDPEGYAPVLTVANGKLKMTDPEPERFPRITAKPGTNGMVVVEIKMYGRR